MITKIGVTGTVLDAGGPAVAKAKAPLSWNVYSGRGKELKERKSYMVHYVMILAKKENRAG